MQALKLISSKTLNVLPEENIRCVHARTLGRRRDFESHKQISSYPTRRQSEPRYFCILSAGCFWGKWNHSILIIDEIDGGGQRPYECDLSMPPGGSRRPNLRACNWAHALFDAIEAIGSEVRRRFFGPRRPDDFNPVSLNVVSKAEM